MMKTLALSLVLSLSSSAHAAGRARVVTSRQPRVPTVLIRDMGELGAMARSLELSKAQSTQVLKAGRKLISDYNATLVAVPVANQLFLMPVADTSDWGAVVPLSKGEKADTRGAGAVRRDLEKAIKKFEGAKAAQDVAGRMAALEQLFAGGIYTTPGGGIGNFIGQDGVSDQQRAGLATLKDGKSVPAGSVITFRRGTEKVPGLWAITESERNMIKLQVPAEYTLIDFEKRTLDGRLLVTLTGQGGKQRFAMVDPASRKVTIHPAGLPDFELSRAKFSPAGDKLVSVDGRSTVIHSYDLKTGKTSQRSFKELRDRLAKTLPDLRVEDVTGDGRLVLFSSAWDDLLVVEIASGRVLARKTFDIYVDTAMDEGDMPDFSEDGTKVVIDRVNAPNTVWNFSR